MLIAALVLLATTSCAPNETGQPPPADQQRLSPPVLIPKDARGVKQCDALTAEQVRALGGNPDSADLVDDDFALNPACSWRASDDRWGMSIALVTDPAVDGLERLYLNQDRGAFDLFEPFELGGHPAVRAEPEVRPDCGVSIGLANTQVADIAVTQRGESIDTCELAKRAGLALLSNLPPLER